MRKMNLHEGIPARLVLMGCALVMLASADLRSAALMSGMVLLTTLLSSVTLSAISKFIPKGARLPAGVLVITGFVSLLDMLAQAFFPVSAKRLGARLAARAARPVLFWVGEGAEDQGEALAVRTALTTALFLAAATMVCALIREPLGCATIWGHPIGFLENVKIPILADTFGGYLVLAVVVAILNAVTAGKKEAAK